MCNGSAATGGEPRVIDRRGERVVPIGIEDFDAIIADYVYVDKTMLCEELVRLGGVTLFCRPRRFGKSTALRMLQSFFEAPVEGYIDDRSKLFEGTAVADRGERAMQEQGIHPVIYLSLNSCGGSTWEACRDSLARQVAAEYRRHRYLIESGSMWADEVRKFKRIGMGECSESELEGSLSWLAEVLHRHHGQKVVILIDEYDKIATEGFLNGYRDEAIAFVKRWLTVAVKATVDLRLAALTGVQRVSKESIFSDLNNFTVDTPLDVRFSEAFGFTEGEVAALAAYMGRAEKAAELAEWYDGYRFGGEPTYNPWSVLSYFRHGCEADAYWTNTSSNEAVKRLIARADTATNAQLTELAEGGEVSEPLDLSVVFGEVDSDVRAIWPQLYLAGYVTTADVEQPGDSERPRRLRVPNLEVRKLFSGELLARARSLAGGRVDALQTLHGALLAGDADVLSTELARLLQAVSYHDLTSENSAHMWLLSLLYGVPGYRFPRSNRESGAGRPDITLQPEADREGELPAVVVEVKFVKDRLSEAGRADAPAGSNLRALAESALVGQAVPREYGADLAGAGLLLWAVAFDGSKHVEAYVQAYDS